MYWGYLSVSTSYRKWYNGPMLKIEWIGLGQNRCQC